MDNNKIDKLQRLIKNNPNEMHYVELLASVYVQQKQWQQASECYAQFVNKNPKNADGYFNYAYNLRFAGHYIEAISSYKQALLLNVVQPEEVYLNMAIIYADYLRCDDNAFNALQLALEKNSNYLPALYNLANFYEDGGDKNQASELFQRILTINPKYFAALARLAQIKKFSSGDDVLIQQIKCALEKHSVELSTRIDLYFALGKALDDCGEYNDAFACFTKANELEQENIPRYNAQEQAAYVDSLKQFFSTDYFASIEKTSDAAPIFICGMFRSGSTLVEQILAAHPKITAGGEREFFIRLVEHSLTPFPAKLLTMKMAELSKVATEYLQNLAQAFPDAEQITDKRPENFLYIGLIKTLFPNARIIYTQRHALDNCLSVFFLRLGARMNYSLTLKYTGHYYKLQQDLMDYWQAQFADTIYTINYDRLIANAESETKALIEFLDLEWSDNCLSFHENKNRVKTASVWQVRKPLYKTSSGRWQNYRKNIAELMKTF